MALADFPSMDVEDYLLLDNTSKTAKYEFSDGNLYMLAGGSPDHSLIAGNLTTLLNNALWETACNVYTSDIRFKVSETKYYHPDITVSCDQRDKETKEDIQHPRLLVEVLSPGTEAKDKGEKLFTYLECPSLEEYLLVNFAQKVCRSLSQRTWQMDISYL